MSSRAACIAATGVLLLTGLVNGPVGRIAAATSPLHWTFDGGPDGWRAVVGPGDVRITLAKEHVKIGTGALEVTYMIAPHTYFAVAKPITVPDAPAITLAFWMKAMKAGVLRIYLTERDGSAYGYPLALPSGEWKRFALTSRQFVLDAGSAGNTDENGRLDVGQLAWITIADFAGLFSRERAKVSFYLDDVRMAP